MRPARRQRTSQGEEKEGGLARTVTVLSVRASLCLFYERAIISYWARFCFLNLHWRASAFSFPWRVYRSRASIAAVHGIHSAVGRTPSRKPVQCELYTRVAQSLHGTDARRAMCSASGSRIATAEATRLSASQRSALLSAARQLNALHRTSLSRSLSFPKKPLSTGTTAI